MFRLDGRVAVVTGAASGIGAATAALFARAGADVVCGWYAGDPHDVGPTVGAVEASGRRALAIEADVSTAEGAERLVDAARSKLGGVDIVVANAAIARRVPSAELDDASWDRLLAINLDGVFRCFRAALPDMIDKGWGRLVATSSIAGAVQGWSDHVHYTAAKAGILGLIRGLAVEVGHHGITVNAVAPGVIETPQSADPENSLGPEGLISFATRVPVGRVGRPEDIASVFLFIASEEAAYLTGQTIVVDGGVTLAMA